MRTGGCTVQQALTAEAASVVKQAVTLAIRRGHAQVTPLHVANTMLTASSGLLRTVCIQSNSHPLQCKALELCLNVALNRLPASNKSSILGGHPQNPSISNALVVAFKRAQTHQRRGSIENQQQLLAVKIELEQLIISILDDPSVSRVMREAGFCSTQVKSNVEQLVSLEICSQNNPPMSDKSRESDHLTLFPPQTATTQVGGNSSKALAEDPIRSEDVMSVIDNLISQRRRSTVIVGEYLTSLEGLVKAVMNKVDKKDIDEAYRDVKFVTLSLSSLAHLSREDIEQKIREFEIKIQASEKSLVLYIGDVNWIFEYRARSTCHQGRDYFSSLEHMVIEIGKWVSGFGSTGKFKLMAIATYQTYTRCKSGYPSLETVWGLHPLTIPADGLSLSLITDSELQINQPTNKKADNMCSWLSLDGKDGKEKQLTCPFYPPTETGRCLLSSSGNSDSATSSLPAWLQQCKNEIKGNNNSDQNCVPVRELCKKWNPSACSSFHKQPNSNYEITLNYSSSTPSFTYEHRNHFHQTLGVCPPRAYRCKQQTKDQNHFLTFENTNIDQPDTASLHSLRIYTPENHKDPKCPCSSSPHSKSNPNSTSSSDVMETEYTSKFKELSAENLKTLCNALEKKVPWQKDLIPDIVSTILQCRSGTKGKVGGIQKKEETWLSFQGFDVDAKEKIARELARLVFGSQINLASITVSNFSSTKADSNEDWRNKRSRNEQSYSSYCEKFGDAVSCNPHRVFLVEDIEQADYFSQKGFKRAMERGRVTNSNGEEVSLGDAIVILCCGSFSSRSRDCSPPVKHKSSEGSQDEKNATSAANFTTSPAVSLDLNISIGDDSNDDFAIDNIGLLESVDRIINFKIQNL